MFLQLALDQALSFAETGQVSGLADLRYTRPATEHWIGVVIGCSVLVLAIIGIASLRRMSKLREGGSAVAQSLGATRLRHNPPEPALRQLRNVVDETAIAAGVPAPEICLLDRPEINALAAGWSPGDAVLVVTRGAIDHLTRDEL